jgi:hypothetical protein
MSALFIRFVLTNGTANKSCLDNLNNSSLQVQLETQMRYRDVRALKC